MNPVFNESKATQVAAKFISLNGGNVNYLVLLKWMYFAEREALLQWGRPITYDLYYSLNKGPILSHVYDLIKRPPNTDSAWSKYITPRQNYSISLHQKCLPDGLSEAEEAVIDSIFKQYSHFSSDPFGFAEYSHDILPEWQDPQGSSTPISYRDILEAGGKSEEEIKEIEAEIEGVCYMDSLLV